MATLYLFLVFFGMIVDEVKQYVSAGFCVLWLPKPYLLIFNEEAVRIINNDVSALDKSEKYHFLHGVMKNGLITSPSQLWRKRRKMFQPGFNVSVIKNYTHDFNKNAAFLIQRLMMTVNEPVNIIHFLKTCSFDNLMGTVLGIDGNDPSFQEYRVRSIQIMEMIESMLADGAANPLIQEILLPLFPYGRKYLKCRKEYLAMVKKIIEKMIETVLKQQKEKPISEEDDCSGAPHKSFAELIVHYHLQDPSFTLNEVADEVSTILIAGFDTVAYTVMWCLFLLSNHPEAQDRVYEEVKHLTGEDITYTDVQDMTYMDTVIKETMRLYPTIPVYSRCLSKDIQCGEHKLLKGTNITLFVYMLHRNPELFPNPDKFDPERFKRSTTKNPWSYVPFAEGIRSCIGKRFALLQIKVTLAHILKNFKLTSPQRVDDVQVEWRAMLSTVQPCLIHFTPRNHASIQE